MNSLIVIFPLSFMHWVIKNEIRYLKKIVEKYDPPSNMEIDVQNFHWTFSKYQQKQHRQNTTTYSQIYIYIFFKWNVFIIKKREKYQS